MQVGRRVYFRLDRTWPDKEGAILPVTAVTTSPITISPIATDIFAINAPCDPGVDVRALLVTGQDCSVLVDTLLRPSDLDGVRAIVESHGKPLYIVNSHADWDHWWGNGAFPTAPVVAHRLTKERQLREGRRHLTSKQRTDNSFADVVLRPATITFDGFLQFDLGGVHLELSALPGHVHDQIVAYVPEYRLFFAADAAEDPIPLVAEGPVAPWARALHEWARKARTVVPAHGAIAGPELLERNAAYLEGLLNEPRRAIPDLVGAPAFYRRAHRRNLKQAAAELEGSAGTTLQE
jgi:glyoxylase-like metal-dependent hydrolase (beta-lactamase superfamily II)